MEEKLQSLKKDHDSCISIAAHIGAESFWKSLIFLKLHIPTQFQDFMKTSSLIKFNLGRPHKDKDLK